VALHPRTPQVNGGGVHIADHLHSMGVTHGKHP